MTAPSVIASGQVTVTSSATQIVAARSTRRKVRIRGVSTVLYLGDSGVTTSNGYNPASGEAVEVETEAAVYGISGGSNVVVTFLEMYD